MCFAVRIGFAAFSGFALTRSGSGSGSKICIAEYSDSRLSWSRYCCGWLRFTEQIALQGQALLTVVGSIHGS